MSHIHLVRSSKRHPQRTCCIFIEDERFRSAGYSSNWIARVEGVAFGGGIVAEASDAATITTIGAARSGTCHEEVGAIPEEVAARITSVLDNGACVVPLLGCPVEPVDVELFSRTVE